MKHQTLSQQVKEVVTTAIDQNPRYRNLNDTQRQKLTAAVMRDAGEYAYELITNSGFIDSIAGTLINALETQDVDDRKELLIKLGELLIDAAVDESKKPISNALDSAVTELAMTRQFYRDGYEAEKELDDVHRAHDMNLAARGA
jgi:hypothetical protein